MVEARRSGFTLIELLVVITIIGILMGLLLPAVNRIRETGRRTMCMNHLRQIGLAVVNYETTHSQYPSAGYFDAGPASDAGLRIADFRSGTMFSWIVSLLPFLEQQTLYDQFDTRLPATEQPLDPQRLQPGVLLCPSDASEGLEYEYGGKRFAKGNYAAWSSPYHSDYMNHYPGALISHRPHRNASIRDGVTNTFLASEVRTRPHNRDERGVWALGWNGATLLAYDAHPPNDMVRNGVKVPRFFYDGAKSANFKQPPNNQTGLNSDTLYECPERAASQLDRMPCSRYAGYWSAPPRSLHPGGVNLVYMDGRTSFLTDEVDQTAMAFLISADAGQVIATVP